MKIIDIDKWNRKNHYLWFSSFADSTVAITLKIDVTKVLDYCKKNKASSFAALMFIFVKAANSVPAFRLRVFGNNPVEIENAASAYTSMTNQGVYTNVRAYVDNGFQSFAEQIQINKEINSNKQYNDETVVSDVYCSCVPWLVFEDVKQPIPDKNFANQSIPRICWCKYFEENGRWYTRINVTASHALVDGKDFSLLLDYINNAIEHITAFLA